MNKLSAQDHGLAQITQSSVALFCNLLTLLCCNIELEEYVRK